MKRYKIALPSLALLVLAIGWSIFWHVASTSVGDAVADWFGREREAQRVWTCPRQAIAGYPFRITLACDKPTFSGRFGSEAAEGSLGGFNAVAQVYQPNNVIVDVEGPLVLRMPEKAREAQVSWKDFRIGLRTAPGAMQRASMVIEAPALNVTGLPRVEAQKFEAHIRRSPTLLAEKGYDVATTIAGFSPPPGLPLPAGEKLTLELVGSVIQGDAAVAAGPLAQRLENWRAAGGRLFVTSFGLSQGGAKIEGSAELALDDQHRLTGSVDVDKAGLRALLPRFGVKPEVIDVGAALSPGKPLKDGDPPGVRLRLQNGRIALGPVVLPVFLPPLY